MNNRPQGVTTAWYFVAVTFDAGSGKVEIHQDPLNTFTFDPTRVVTERTTTIRTLATNDSPLLIAGAWERPDRVYAHFNGKIDNPRLYRRGAQPAGDRRHQAGAARAAAARRLGLRGRHRVGTHHRHRPGPPARPDREPADAGRDRPQLGLVRDGLQAGAAAVRRHLLPRRRHRRCPVGGGVRVPRAGHAASRGCTRRGCAAAASRTTSRSRSGRGRGSPTSARIALLIPTFSYLAYAGTGTSAFRPLSLYSRHSDGSGVCYSSRLRPITNMRPKIQTNNPWQFMADTHLIDWLEVKRFDGRLLHRRGPALRGRRGAHALQGRDDRHAPRVLLARDAQRAAHLPERRRPADVSRRQRLLLGDADGSDRPLHRGAAARRHRALAGRAGRALPQPHRRARRAVAVPRHGAAAVLRRRVHGPGLRSQPALPPDAGQLRSARRRGSSRASAATS